jgi:hypothetical protein
MIVMPALAAGIHVLRPQTIQARWGLSARSP